jgi:hypothetical protein
MLAQEEIAKQHVSILPHTHLILHLVIYFSFLWLKEKLHGSQFWLGVEVTTATDEALWDLPANILWQCLQQLYQHWQTCIAANNDIFKGGMYMCVNVCIL